MAEPTKCLGGAILNPHLKWGLVTTGLVFATFPLRAVRYERE